MESLIMLPLALVLGVLTWRKSPSLFRSSMRGAGVRFVELIPRISLALLAADDAVFAWRDRLLDLYGGLARAIPALET